MAANLPSQADLLRFKSDFPLYAYNCLKIRDKDGSISDFKLNRAQRYAHKRIQDQLEATGKVRAIILKGRQQGMSTYVEGRFYWRTSLNVGKQAFILTHSQQSTDVLFEMTRRFHDLCPPQWQQPTKAASAKELSFSDMDSGFGVSTAGSKATGRGRTIQYFHGSEIGFWDNCDDHMAGLGQAVPFAAGTEIILESTANGVGNAFHRRWLDAERGIGDYIPIFVPWFWQEEYSREPGDGFSMSQDELDYQRLYGLTDAQMCWRQYKVTDEFRGDAAFFAQEYPATPAEAFRRVEGNPIIEPGHVQEARKFRSAEPAAGPRIMGVDPAEYGADSSAVAFRQGRACTNILAYHGRGPMELVGIVAKLADDYKPVAINVDCTGVGSGVADRLTELGYPVHRVHFGERALDDQQYGIRRDEMWGLMRDWFADKPCSIPDDDALASDLCAPQYTYDSSRRMKLESKEQMRKRGVRSPDRGDALALTFATRINPMKHDNYRDKKTGLRKKQTRDWRAT